MIEMIYFARYIRTEHVIIILERSSNHNNGVQLSILYLDFKESLPIKTVVKAMDILKIYIKFGVIKFSIHH